MSFFDRLEKLIENMCHLVEKLAPVAVAVAPLTGPAAAAVAGAATAATVIATATDKAIEAHEAAGGSTTSAVSGLLAIANAVADSDVTDDVTASKIRQITSVIPPDILAGITQ